MTTTQRQYLIFDADDTLWDNNIYFEAAFDRFVTFLDHEHLTSSEIQRVLDEFELETRATHGYGARAFAHSLRLTFRKITGLADDHPDVAAAERLGLDVLEAPFSLMPGVADTLLSLHQQHDLLMLTKGHDAEQQIKIDRSGIAHLFSTIVITPEKNPSTYADLIQSRELTADRTWMIGNSPRSDINPALAAGINAVFIPHPRTWHLEVEEFHAIPAPGRTFVELGSFPELIGLFATTEQSSF
jgi:putative hydrolase of the HAD superfamily